jgi:hypothetical protein
MIYVGKNFTVIIQINYESRNPSKTMQKHTKVYFDYFDYGEQDVILCECCMKVAVDIHHIEGRGPGKDVIKNLMALCRKCHEKAHEGKIAKSHLQLIHNFVLSGVRKVFLK